jgi:hypothetical protein
LRNIIFNLSNGVNADYEDFKYKELTEKIINEAQLLNYLKASDIEIGLLLNFGPQPEVKRKAFDNSRKRQIYRISNPDLSA